MKKMWEPKEITPEYIEEQIAFSKWLHANTDSHKRYLQTKKMVENLKTELKKFSLELS